MPSNKNYDDDNIIQVKTILLGEVSVWKTSLIKASVGMNI
jgi:hypothetical protein